MAEQNSSDEGSSFGEEKVKFDELSDDEFEDAESGIGSIDPGEGDYGHLEENLQEIGMATSLFFNNEYTESRKMLKEKSKVSMFHALGLSVFENIEAFMTFESEDINKALGQVKDALSVNKRYKRKENLTTSLVKMVGIGSDCPLSEVEIFAELVYAELHLLHACLTFIQDENLVSFLKGALHIRRTYQSYSVCKKVMEKKRYEESPSIKHFVGGVLLGNGTFNVLLSLLPARVISLLEWVGFSCSKEKGFEELQKGYDSNNIHSLLCGIIIISYHIFAAIHWGTHDGNWVSVDRILSELLVKHPNGVYFHLFKGRREALKGNLEEAKNVLIKAHECEEGWQQFSHICYWELMWYNIFELNWEKALEYAELLREESNWSKAGYTYICAVLLMMREDKDEKTLEKIDQYMADVGKLRQKLAGKSIPLEKFVARKARKYFEQGKRLVLPAMEIMYVWFGLVILKHMPDLLKKHMDWVKKELDQLEALKVENNNNNNKAAAKSGKNKKKGPEFYYFDDYCLIQLLRGTLLNISNHAMQAELAFSDVVENYAGIQKDHYLGPYATVELVWIYIEQNKIEEAKMHIKNIKQNYKHYSLESKLHFRLHAAHSKIENLASKKTNKEQMTHL